MIDLRPVGHISGWLLVPFGLMMLPPAMVDWHDGSDNYRALVACSILTLTSAGALVLSCSDASRRDLGIKQGFLVTTLTWVAFIVAGALPFMLGAPRLSLTDAIFEATSAMTTTGATVIVGLDDLPRGMLLWRMLMTWAGGIGVILLAIVMLPILKIGGMQLLRNADFNTMGKVAPRAKEIALSFGTVYLILTVACALGYSWGGLDGFHALTHAMSTVATGGMANSDSSFIELGARVQYVAIVFMLLGAMSFVRFVQFVAGDPRPLFQDSQIRAFLLLYLFLCAGLVLARWLEGTEIDEFSVREVAFSMASVLTTTGFATVDYTAWGSLAAVIFFCAMMVCGCSGSTSGGPKVFRYQLLLSAINAEIRRLHSPSAVFTPRFQGAAVTPEVMNSVIAFFMMFFLTLGIGAVLLVMIGLDPLTAISGAAATLTNVGPGLGPIIGPVGNYAPLPDPAIWVMTILMFVGRLEILTVYVLFTATFWRS
jgi:trk system potassium uptake protein TrkH